MKTFLIALRGIVYMSGFVLLWGWIAWRVRVYDRSLGIVLPAWTEWPGLILVIAGAILAFTCLGIFIARGRGTAAPFDPPREFVALGPYKRVRNPMYVGGITLLVGFGLYLHSFSILLLALPVFFLAHLFVVFYEEPDLARRFGASYEAYCKAVPRWFPR